MNSQREEIWKINKISRAQKVAALQAFFGVSKKEAREELRDMGEI